MDIIRAGFVAAILMWAVSVEAIPVRTYALDLEFDRCTTGINLSAQCLPSDAVHVGSRHTGYFTVDENVFATDGYKDGVGFESFFLQLGETIWDSQGSGSLRTRGYNPITNVGGEIPWTLLVENGELAGICCGVFSDADVPFVDLFSWVVPGGMFTAPHVNAFGWLSNDPVRAFGAMGTFEIHRVPEPSTPALLFVAIATLIGLRSRAARGKHCGVA